MDGLLKFAAIMILLYMFGWLGKKNQQRVEKWFDRIARLFNQQQRKNQQPNPDAEISRERSKLQKSFNDPKSFEQFLQEYKLSHKEWQIIELVCDGLTNKEIEEKLFCSLATVKDYLHKIFQKTGVKNRVQLVNFIRNTIDENNSKGSG